MEGKPPFMLMETFGSISTDRNRAEEIVKVCLNFQVDGRGVLSAKVLEQDFMWLVEKSEALMLSQGTLLHLKAPIKIVGDIHGQYLDLLKIFEIGGLPPQNNYLFLGDYVDRGPNGLECMCFLLALKVRFPENIFLLRGNHECESINRVYGFFAECKSKYSMQLWEAHVSLFASLPLAAVIEDKIFCIHGGLSPSLESLAQIKALKRPLQVPNRGMVVDFLWADPDADIRGWAESDRGISHNFGADVVKEFLKRNQLELIVRAHQVVEAGYEFFADRQLVTIFSAPNYCGEFDNAGALMMVSEDLCCSFAIIPPSAQTVNQNAYDGRPRTPLLD